MNQVARATSPPTARRHRIIRRIRSPRGITLLELTVVIVVFLSLIAILFVGAKAWRRGSDRALCILNLQSVQKGVRSYANLTGRSPGETVPGLQAEIIGPNRFLERMPDCPATGIYAGGGDTIPEIGNLYVECSLSATNLHEPPDMADW